jgi:hypothetical protein
VERLVQHFAGREAQSIYLVPAYLNLDAEHNYPTRSTPTSARAAGEEPRVYDGAHPSSEGYFQIADSIFCWLKATGPSR